MAICWERAVPLAFHLCCFFYNCRYLFPVLVFRSGYGIRLYRFLIIALSSALQLRNPGPNICRSCCTCTGHLDRVKRIWYLSPMRAAKVQASLRIRAVSPEPPLLAHTSSESRGTFRQKARSLASLNGWACAVKTCRDGMLEDTNSLDGAHLLYPRGVFLSLQNESTL